MLREDEAVTLSLLFEDDSKRVTNLTQYILQVIPGGVSANQAELIAQTLLGWSEELRLKGVVKELTEDQLVSWMLAAANALNKHPSDKALLCMEVAQEQLSRIAAANE